MFSAIVIPQTLQSLPQTQYTLYHSSVHRFQVAEHTQFYQVRARTNQEANQEDYQSQKNIVKSKQSL
jgi:hypothetical protein